MRLVSLRDGDMLDKVDFHVWRYAARRLYAAAAMLEQGMAE